MFEAAELGRKIEKAEYKDQALALRGELLDVQRRLSSAGTFPVIIVFAGVDGAGKGETVNLLSEWMDPRYLITRAFDEPSDEERERPEYWRFWRNLPPKGRIGLFLSSWYSRPILDRVNGDASKTEFARRLERVEQFERTLTANNALILKFWMHLGKDEQRRRLRKLEKDRLTRWRVARQQWKNWRMYDRFVAAAEQAMFLLVTTKFFVLHGASQYADIPLGFFFLATLTLLCLAEASPTGRPRLLVLAGLTAGLAAWTKNEGLLFVPITIAVFLLMQPNRERARDAPALIIGLAPVMALLVVFKIWMAAPNDLLGDQGMAQTAARLLEAARYRQIFGGFVGALLEVSTNGALPTLLGAYALAAGPVPAGPPRRAGSLVAIVVAFMLAGYAAVLLVAPAPRLGTNIRSINRLLLQLWPSMLLAYFCLVRTAEEACRPESRIRPSSEPA
jgi:polyphosphate kinase 2 (PPK2 family)